MINTRWIGHRKAKEQDTLRKLRRGEYHPAPGRPRYHEMPDEQLIARIPLVRPVEFEISDKETATLRSRLYSINKEGYVRFRTMREGGITLVWRIA